MGPAGRISAAIITLNEERRLPRLLQRLAWVDEIVVVDSGSQDRTVELARAAGARVEFRKFDTYAQQRNHALDLATAEWVLSIDADELPARRMASEVRYRIQQARYTAFRVPIRSAIFGRRMRYCGTQDDRPIRFFRRDAARWEGDVHEALRVRGRVGRLENWLEHQTLADLNAFLSKMDRYTTLAAAARVQQGRLPGRHDRWLAPVREFARRMVWKQGLLDGPLGWAFCVLSGLSEWVLASKHRALCGQGGRNS